VSGPASIPFIDLHPGEDDQVVREAIDRVIRRGWFVLGPEVEHFEAAFAAACGGPFAIGVGSGTDAISLSLRALGIGQGDEVIVPAMTAAFTALAVIAAGARPVFADVDAGTLTLDPAACAAAVTSRTRALVPVHLYGQPCDMERLRRVAERHNLAIVEDCCQAHGATEKGVAIGSRANAAAFSFYPTKNLGGIGDGGAVITADASIAERIRRLRNGGQSGRYEHIEAGVNSRLDELQAAVLRARLPFLADWTARRRALAATYRRELPTWVKTVDERDPGHVYHLFPVRVPDRDRLRARLTSREIETLIHYPVAVPRQPAFANMGPADCPVAEAAASELVSLPLYPRLAVHDAARVAHEIEGFQKGRQA